MRHLPLLLLRQQVAFSTYCCVSSVLTSSWSDTLVSGCNSNRVWVCVLLCSLVVLRASLNEQEIELIKW